MKKSSSSELKSRGKTASVLLLLVLLIVIGIYIYRTYYADKTRVFVGEMEQPGGKKADVTITFKTNGTGFIEFGHALTVPVKLTFDQTTIRLPDLTGEPSEKGPGVATYVLKDNKLIISQKGKEIGTLTQQ